MKKLYKAIVRRAAQLITEDHGLTIISNVADKLFLGLRLDEMEDNVCNTIVNEHIDVDSISETIVNNFDYSEVVYHIDITSLAEELDIDEIGSAAADNIDYEELAKSLSPVEKLAGGLELENLVSAAADKVVSSSHMSTLVEKMLDIAADKLLDRAVSMSEDITVDYLAD
jgi:hypothetical protein